MPLAASGSFWICDRPASDGDRRAGTRCGVGGALDDVAVTPAVGFPADFAAGRSCGPPRSTCHHCGKLALEAPTACPRRRRWPTRAGSRPGSKKPSPASGTPGCPCSPRPHRRAWPPQARPTASTDRTARKPDHLAAGRGLHFEPDRLDPGPLLVKHHKRVLAVLEPAFGQVQPRCLDLLRITPQIVPVEPHCAAAQAL